MNNYNEWLKIESFLNIMEKNPNPRKLTIVHRNEKQAKIFFDKEKSILEEFLSWFSKKEENK